MNRFSHTDCETVFRNTFYNIWAPANDGSFSETDCRNIPERILYQMKTKTLQWMNTIAYVLLLLTAVIVIPVPIGTDSVTDLSGRLAGIFAPAPYTYLLFPLLLIFTGLFVLYQWRLFGNVKTADSVRSGFGLWFAFFCLCQAAVLATTRLALPFSSLLFQSALLLSLVILTRRSTAPGMSPIGLLSTGICFRLYLGFRFAMTVIYLAAFFDRQNIPIPALSDTIQMILLLFGLSLIGIAASTFFSEPLITVSILWVTSGILIRQLFPSGYASPNVLIVFMTVISIAVLILSLLLTLLSTDIPPKTTTHLT